VRRSTPQTDLAKEQATIDREKAAIAIADCIIASRLDQEVNPRNTNCVGDFTDT
jgi:hypothetical protein